MRAACGIVIASVLCLGLFASSAAAASGEGAACGGDKIRTASGCTGFAAAGREVRAIVHEAVRGDDLRAVLARVDVGGRTLAALSPGESMAGVPANLRMNFRIGSISIPYLIDVLFQLRDKGRLSLGDPVSKWLPNLPNADAVTLRMLASATAGYPDWVQGNPSFQEALLADPFRQWTNQELLENAFGQPLICDPGECFHYAHTGFVILGRVVQKVTGKSLRRQLRTRVLRPLGLRHTESSALPAIPGPVLHSYVSQRGTPPIYEDSTYWSPSWGISKDLLMTSTIGDVIRSAKALGSGALVSSRATRQRTAPITVGLPHPPPPAPGKAFTDDFYYGLGVLVANGWQVQNPMVNGYTSIMAVLAPRRISVALSVTEGQGAAEASTASGTNFSERLLRDITRYLTPNRAAVLPNA